MVRSTQRNAGFSLVELLVVVAIVVVLIGTLLPALGRARDHANRVKCASNLRSIGHGLTAYAHQYGYYPGCYGLGGVPFAVWPVRLRPYLGGEQDVFFCPSQDERCQWVKGAAPATPADAATSVHVALGYDAGEPVLHRERYFSYGYNSEGTSSATEARGLGHIVNQRAAWGRTQLVRTTRVRKPAAMIAIADTVADGQWDFMISPWYEGMYPGRVHRGGANVLFCDGHVTWHAQEELVDMRYATDNARAWEVRRMWNNDHRPAELGD
ncbi:MAG TPA: DUF1559 domain-containing protein [Tepidisphaeraceae bacterium]|nr:DUF1559 domain-containing protein [Tepidisphaeraceae bacterium]